MQQLLRALVQELSGLRHGDALAAALEQDHIQLLLQQLQLIAQGRLGHIELPGCLVDAAGLGDFPKVFQLTYFHRISLTDIFFVLHRHRNNIIHMNHTVL